MTSIFTLWTQSLIVFLFSVCVCGGVCLSHVMEELGENGSGESPCLQSPWSMVEEESTVLGWRWGDIWEGYIWGITGYMDICVFEDKRLSMHACTGGLQRDWSSSPTLCDLGQGSPLSGPVSVYNNVYLSICTGLLNAYMRYSSCSPEDNTEV